MVTYTSIFKSAALGSLLFLSMLFSISQAYAAESPTPVALMIKNPAEAMRNQFVSIPAHPRMVAIFKTMDECTTDLNHEYKTFADAGVLPPFIIYCEEASKIIAEEFNKNTAGKTLPYAPFKKNYFKQDSSSIGPATGSFSSDSHAGADNSGERYDGVSKTSAPAKAGKVGNSKGTSMSGTQSTVNGSGMDYDSHAAGSSSTSSQDTTNNQVYDKDFDLNNVYCNRQVCDDAHGCVQSCITKKGK